MSKSNQGSFSPKANYILLEEIEDDAVSKGGIIIPATSRQKLNMGKILEFGPEVNQVECNLKVGEIVIFPFHTEYRVAGHILVRVDEIIAGDNLTTPQEEDKICEICGSYESVCKKQHLNTPRRAPLGI